MEYLNIIKTKKQLTYFTICRLFIFSLMLFIVIEVLKSQFIENKVFTYDVIYNSFFFICIFLPLILYYGLSYVYDSNKLIYKASYLISISFSLFYILSYIFIYDDFELTYLLKLILLLLITLLTLISNKFYFFKRIPLYVIILFLLIASGVSIGVYIVNKMNMPIILIIFLILCEAISNIFLIGFYFQNTNNRLID